MDSPTPYSLDTFVSEIDAQRPPGRDKKEQEPYNSVQNKIEVLRRDSRMSFLMAPWDGAGDEFSRIAAQLIGEGDQRQLDLLAGDD